MMRRDQKGLWCLYVFQKKGMKGNKINLNSPVKSLILCSIL